MSAEESEPGSRRPVRAVIFDLDGLLIDSEPLWEQAEVDAFGAVGLSLTVQDCRQTTGLRIEEVAAHWWTRSPWNGPGPEAVVADIIERVAEAIRRFGEPMPGALRAIDLCTDRGLDVAVASSSDRRIIEVALESLGLGGVFPVVESAEGLAHAKPHPEVFLNAAAGLGTSPLECLVLEDSLNGVLAAKAARMACIAVPAPHHAGDPRFALADRLLASLEDLEAAHLD